MKYLFIGAILYAAVQSLCLCTAQAVFYPSSYQSARSTSMGGTRTTLGLYEDNFDGNPARIAANPVSQFTLFQLTGETNQNTWMLLHTAHNTQPSMYTPFMGKPLHGKINLLFPAFYIAPHAGRRWALSGGIPTHIQADAWFRQSIALNAQALITVAPQCSFAYRLTRQNALTLGITARALFQGSAQPDLSLADFIQTQRFFEPRPVGAGKMLLFDIGSTVLLIDHRTFQLEAAVSLYNLFNASFQRFPLPNAPLVVPSPRSLSLGVAAFMPYQGPFKHSQIALEFNHLLLGIPWTKTVHMGFETTLFLLKIRMGLNQGYPTAGMGLNLHPLTLELATTGEELGTNAGMAEDRRWLFSIGMHV